MCGALAAAHFFLEARIGAGELDVDPGLGTADEAAKEGLGWKGEKEGVRGGGGERGRGGRKGSVDEDGAGLMMRETILLSNNVPLIGQGDTRVQTF
jgi:hypothetical protein